MNRMIVGCLCGGMLAAVGCSDAPVPTSPSVVGAPDSTAAASGNVAAVVPPTSARSGDLRVTKECSGYTGGPGSFCRITASNVKEVEVDSIILYLQPDQLVTPEGSDVILDPPGPGNNKAFGHCSLAVGVCTFSGGTGKFTRFEARVGVTPKEDFSEWYWNGTYSFLPND